MDSTRFDDVTRALSPLLTRRGLAGMLGLAALGTLSEAEGKRKKRKKRKKKNKNNGGNEVKFNEFGCVNVGDFCESSGQCCSGICLNNTCQAHDQATCQAGQSDVACSGILNNVDCSAPGNNDGLCLTTTGAAGYCVGDRVCTACSKDADCVGACGQNAACIRCDICVGTGGTACAGPVPDSCP